MAYIEVKNLTKSYGNTPVIENISVTMQEGTLTTLLGASGSGKSTLLRCIAVLESIDSGQILIDGKDVTDIEPRFRNVGMVFQHYALFPNMTVLENVMFGLRLKGVSNTAKAEKMIGIVAWFVIQFMRSIWINYAGDSGIACIHLLADLNESTADFLDLTVFSW